MGTRPGDSSHSVNTSLHSNACIVHMASDMRENLYWSFSDWPKDFSQNPYLSLQIQFADSLAVQPRLLRGSRTCEFNLSHIEPSVLACGGSNLAVPHIIHSKII